MKIIKLIKWIKDSQSPAQLVLNLKSHLSSTRLCHSHMLAVTVHDLVPDGVLVGEIFIVEEMLPALRLVEVPNLR